MIVFILEIFRVVYACFSDFFGGPSNGETNLSLLLRNSFCIKSLMKIYNSAVDFYLSFSWPSAEIILLLF